MSETQLFLKINSLPETMKQELLDFLEFLLSKKGSKKSTSKKMSSYKKNILSVSVWTDKDIKDMETNLKNFGTWQIEKW
ncbi:MAG: hypothetical protein COS14_01190 [Bacteroidetes bacterium CG02_land_8_20_14_3_00_31_25]|nr:DUF2281 domain-containing protein [Bacteroidota bacterium]PIV63070.1 MAG: hypothetical protein COS14_01190 [Bacteroidetes bacterium CG02_land_8_20_14_3_00_31_25]PIX32654.1 MAG: hypothetical protein COZ59_12850 [Bacteroidetes bacterium CG_4_8_14_3_um_filter_31_14]PIY03021.1 MAG: hypothetical protein COZ21_11130 [Bacteroidetes bacterium CG_4_10_14_3_um_filter_31_20]